MSGQMDNIELSQINANLYEKRDFNMTKKLFTAAEQRKLAANKYTYNVTENVISFTVEFKEAFWDMYWNQNLPIKYVFRQLGYDPEILGYERMRGIVKGIKTQALSPEGFRMGYGRKGSRKMLSEATKQNRMQAELMYLRQEVEFLKKVSSLGNTKK